MGTFDLTGSPLFLLGRDIVGAVAGNQDDLVDAFVAYLNAVGFEPKFPNDVPEELRTSGADYDTFNWQIRSASVNPWVEEMDEKLPQRCRNPSRRLFSDTGFVISRLAL